MPVEFISATHTTPTTEASAGGRRPDLDIDYTRRFVRALDDGGFDYTLVAYGSPSADSLQVAQFVVNNSERIKPMIAHRPGFVFPTLAAKAFATIDQIGRGRLGIHIISGGNDTEQRREGDYLTKRRRRRAGRGADLRPGAEARRHGLRRARRRAAQVAGELGPGSLALQHQIKRVFDPTSILNPGQAL